MLDNLSEEIRDCLRRALRTVTRGAGGRTAQNQVTIPALISTSAAESSLWFNRPDASRPQRAQNETRAKFTPVSRTRWTQLQLSFTRGFSQSTTFSRRHFG
jgi:hypothetical protein